MYSTHDEIRFLNKLGTFSVRQMPRLQLLMSYRDSMRIRKQWDNIKPAVILSHVNKLISECEGRWHGVG